MKKLTPLIYLLTLILVLLISSGCSTDKKLRYKKANSVTECHFNEKNQKRVK